MANVSKQIIKKYCDSVEDRIAACCDNKVAKYLKQSICSEIKQKCKSEPVLDFVKQYVDNLIQVKFQNSKNWAITIDTIKKNIPIEELISRYPHSVNYLMKKGIKCIVCGEPIWGTLEDAVKEKRFNDQDLNKIVRELNEMI